MHKNQTNIVPYVYYAI